MTDAARALLALALFGSWYGHLLTVLTADRPGYGRRLRLARADLRNPVKRGCLIATLPFLLVLYAWVGRVAELWSALGILTGLFALRRASFAAWPDGVVGAAGKYAPAAAALLGYLSAQVLGHALSTASPERLGWEAAAGVFAASYVLSGVSKLKKSGWAWTSAGVMGLLLAERAHGASGGLRRLRLWVIARPALCASAGRAALLIELGAALFVVPELRWIVLALLTAMQLGIAILLGYVELEWLVLGLAVTLGSAR